MPSIPTMTQHATLGEGANHASAYALRVERLSRVVDGKPIVADISVDIETQEFVAVVGRSGAGKSSFLRLLNRLDEPTSGTVYLDGQDYRDIPPRQLRRRIGMVMQAAFLFPGTVADNLRFGPRQHGEELPRAAVEELLDHVGLAGFAERSVINLSGGEAQRVSVARALANRPEILLLDEPTSALDDDTEAEVETLIRRLAGEYSLTCLMVTHDDAQAARLATMFLLVEDGRLVHYTPMGEGGNVG